MSLSPPASLSRRLAPWTALFFLCVFFRVVGLTGIDFGPHWDEHYHQKDLKNAVERGDFLSRKYIYNGLYYWPGVIEQVGLFVDAIPALAKEAKVNTGKIFELSSTEAGRKLQSDFATAVYSDAHLLAVRSTYLHICLTALLAAYLFASSVTRSRAVGVCSAALLATCWEFGYYVRWYAVDSIMATFVLWVCASLARAIAARTDIARILWTAAAALCAALAVGAKITGGTMLVVVCIVAPFLPPYDGYRSGRGRVGMAALVLGVVLVVFTTVFVTTTPGVLADPIRYVADVIAAAGPYSVPRTGVHGVQTRSHLLAAFGYWMVGCATWKPLGVVVALAGFAGVFVLVRARATRALGIALIVFFVMHLIGTTTASKFIVRNQLNALVVLVACAPIAFAALFKSLPRAKAPVLACFVVLLSAQAAHAVWAARSVVTTTRETILDDAKDRIGGGAWVTPKVAAALGARVRCDAETTIPDDDVSPTVLFFHNEFEDAAYPPNGPSIGADLTSHEVNYDWYGTWVGRNADNYIVVVTKEWMMKQLHLREIKMQRCAQAQPSNE
jgi:hypothetical protein